MRKAIQLATTMLAASASSVMAAQPYEGQVALLFYRGQEVKIVSYSADVPKEAIGHLSCKQELGSRVGAFEGRARKDNGGLIGWTLQSVQCLAANDHWVKIVQRVPVRQSGPSDDGE
jgi:hypothetical protein